MHLVNGQSIAGQLLALEGEVKEVTTCCTLSEDAFCPWHIFQNHFDMLTELLNYFQIRTHDLDPDGCSHACGKHINPGLDGHGPGVGDTRKPHLFIKAPRAINQFIRTFMIWPDSPKHFLQPVWCPRRVPSRGFRPLRLGFEKNDCFHHRERRWIGCRFCTACLAEDMMDF